MQNASRQRLLVGALVALASGACATDYQVPPEAGREQQWLYRNTLGSNQVEPTAVFLAWDYSSVLFTAKCDSRTRQLVLRSELENGPSTTVEPIQISSGASTVRLKTTVAQG